MKAKSKITGIEQEMTKADWDVLTESGHSKNFDITDPDDKEVFAPAELKGKKADVSKAD